MSGRWIALGWFCLGLSVGLGIPKLLGESIKLHVVHEFRLTPKAAR